MSYPSVRCERPGRRAERGVTVKIDVDDSSSGFRCGITAKIAAKPRSGGARYFALSTMMMGEMSQGQREMQSLVRAANATARAQGSMEPVTLVANDGTEIIIDRRAAMVSGTIKSMLAGPGARTISVPMLLPREARRLAHSTSDIARGACVPHLQRSPVPARACSRVH